MNTQSELERIVRGWLEERVAEPPSSGLASVLERVSTTPQRPRGWLDRLTRRRRTGSGGAPDQNRPSDGAGRGRDGLMVASTGLVAAGVLVIALVLVVPRDPSQPASVPGARSPVTHEVAFDGGGDFTTIGDAIAAAVDGDTILVGPGEYLESLVIDKDIALRGDGAAGAVVIRIPADAAPYRTGEIQAPFGIRLVRSDAEISDLRLEGRQGATISVIVEGGAPRLTRLRVERGDPSFLLLAGSTATLTDSSWDGYLAVRDGAAPVIEGNTISSAIVSIDGPGETILRDNTFLAGAGTSLSADARGIVEGNDLTGGNIGIDSGSDILVQDNTLHGFLGADAAIAVRDAGSSATVSGNTVSGSRAGIAVIGGATGSVEGNLLIDNGRGVIANTRDVVIDGNTIRGSTTGVWVAGGRVVGNTIEDNDTGMILTGRDSATITGNAFCGNGVNVRRTDAEPVSLDGNEVCPVTAAPEVAG